MKKVIIVTGASSGIGKASARKLIQEGHVVYGAARRLEKMQDLIDAGGHAVSMDVTNHAQVQEEILKIIEKEGRVDVLLNNAGYGIWGPVEETTYDRARRQFEVNLFGLAEVTKAVLPVMRSQNSGTIINVTSVGGKVYTPLGSWYHATKHALEGWSDCLRLELKKFKINVVILEPGLVHSEFDQAMDHRFGESDDSPYKEMIDAMEIAQAENYLPERSSHPSVIAKTVSKIVSARKPRTRYATGKLAKPILFVRKIFSDRMFDRLILSMAKGK